jgi:hypothetical protein
MKFWNLYAESVVRVAAGDTPPGSGFCSTAVFELEDGRAVWWRDDWADTSMNPVHVTSDPPVFHSETGAWASGDVMFFQVRDGDWNLTPEMVMAVISTRPGHEFLVRQGMSEREWLRQKTEHRFGPVRG